MRRDRLVALIVAVALFMENLDSTVIATSLSRYPTAIPFTRPAWLRLAAGGFLSDEAQILSFT